MEPNLIGFGDKTVRSQRFKLSRIGQMKFHFLKNCILLLVSSCLAINISCSSNPLLQKSDRNSSSKIENLPTDTKPINEREISKKIDAFSKVLVLRGKKLTKKDWFLHDELLSAYIQLKNQSLETAKITIPENSKVEVTLPSFCLDPNRVAPSTHESFQWIKKDPGIPYYQEILKRSAVNLIEQSDAQTIIWNLQSETYWENYPAKLQTILQKIDPNVALKLPSILRSKAKDSAVDFLKNQVPFLQTAEDFVSTVKGEYQNYTDYAQSIAALTSKFPTSKNLAPISIPDSALYAETKSDGYTSQKILIHNPTNKSQNIDVSDYYLQSSRKDVQRIGLSGQAKESDSLLKRLEKVLYENMAQLGVGFTPILGDAADIYELVIGRDFLSGSKLTWEERLLSGVGIIAGSGTGYRYASRAINAPEEFLLKFERGFEQVAKKELGLARTNLGEAKELIGHTELTKHAIEKSPTLNKIYDQSNFQKTDFYIKPNGEVIPAKGYRYIPSEAPYLSELRTTGSIPARVDNTYISFNNFSSPKEASSHLQVPHDGRIKVEFDTAQILDDIQIPRGKWGDADWLEPITKDYPEYGKGGAYQAITRQKIEARRIVDLKTGEVLYEKK